VFRRAEGHANTWYLCQGHLLATYLEYRYTAISLEINFPVRLCVFVYTGIRTGCKAASFHRSVGQLLSLSCCKASLETRLCSCRLTRVSPRHLMLLCYELQGGRAEESARLQVDLHHPSCTWVQNIRTSHIYQLCWPCITPRDYLLDLFPLAHYDMI